MKQIRAAGKPTATKPQNKERYEFIIAMRKDKKSISEIGRAIGLTPQGVAWYINRWGDYGENKKT